MLKFVDRKNKKYFCVLCFQFRCECFLKWKVNTVHSLMRSHWTANTITSLHMKVLYWLMRKCLMSMFSLYSNSRCCCHSDEDAAAGFSIKLTVDFIHMIHVFRTPSWCSAALPPSPCTDAPYCVYCILRAITVSLLNHFTPCPLSTINVWFWFF